MVSKRKNRLLREREAERRMLRSPHYIDGARLSGVPDTVERINERLAELDNATSEKEG